MSRYPSNGGYDNSLYGGGFGQQSSAYYGPQNEVSNTSFNEASGYYRHQVGRINQSVNDQGLLSPMQLMNGQGAAAHNYYAQGEIPPHVRAHHHKHRSHPRHHYGRSPQQHGSGDAQTGDGQQGKYQDSKYDKKTYDSATYAAGDAKANAKIVAQVARSMGVDPATAIAAMLVESGGNSKAIGDHGTSFGLFQLHKGGELGKMSPQQAFDPEANARVALSYFKKGEQQNPGTMVANAQRPADRAGYARQINARMAQARQLLQQADNS